jgi:hypothetical protein
VINNLIIGADRRTCQNGYGEGRHRCGVQQRRAAQSTWHRQSIENRD